jgi:KTSC domain-containing protein
MTPQQQEKVDRISRTPIKTAPVASSQIQAIGHDPETNTLAIEFKSGGLYHYGNVDADLYREFSTAQSIGSFFHNRIKPKADLYPYLRIEAPSTEPSSSEQQQAA